MAAILSRPQCVEIKDLQTAKVTVKLRTNFSAYKYFSYFHAGKVTCNKPIAFISINGDIFKETQDIIVANCASRYLWKCIDIKQGYGYFTYIYGINS